MKILVVDDNVDAADTLRDLLRALGYGDVRSVYSPTEALFIAPLFPPDVFVLDIEMPGMDGFELMRTLRQDRQLSHATFIAVTGYAAIDRQAAEAGFDYHFKKPVDLAALRAVLDKPQVAGQP